MRKRVRLAAIITIGEGTYRWQPNARRPSSASSTSYSLAITRSSGAILFGLDGFIVEMQARAMQVLPAKVPLAAATKISGMAREGVRESLDRIAQAATAA